MILGGEVFVGGFGDVRQAKLRTSLFGKDPIVALKTLRPTGNREQRIRVIAVRTAYLRRVDERAAYPLRLRSRWPESFTYGANLSTGIS